MFDAATQERFWAKVDRSPGNSACWPWVGAAYAERGRVRGRFYALGRCFHAYQAATIIAHGMPAKGMESLHSCDNPMCCNPRHLRWGTHAENMADMAERGRGTLKTHCKHGHPLSGDNLRILKRGNRECRACQARRKAEYIERSRENG